MQRLSKQKIVNLTTLANYLIALPKGYKEFNMDSFAENPRTCEAVPPKRIVPNCGTVACAAGHGPFAGIRPTEHDRSWWDYVDNNFLKHESISHFTKEFAWCFGGEWSEVDNTPQGAGKRILWMLENKNPPKDWKKQMAGEAPLCYL